MVKTIVLFTILILASCFDIKKRQVPNLLILASLLAGLVFRHSISGTLYLLLTMAFLFCIGALRFLGFGDVKLWMVLAGFVGFLNSIFIIGGAALLLILYAFLRKREEFQLIARHTFTSMGNRQMPETIEQTAYAFAPFILMATLFYYVWRWFF